MTPARIAIATLTLLLLAGATADSAYKGRKCTPPKGHKIADCRTGVHGTPDLSRAAFKALKKGAEVTFSERIESLAPNPAVNGQRQWPLIDSLGQPLGVVQAGGPHPLTVYGSDGTPYRVTSIRVRGRGCAASTTQQKRFTLAQVIAKAPGGGTQGFLALAALDRTTASGRKAAQRHSAQKGTGCGPSGPERGKVQPLKDPAVGKVAHARLSNGVINTVTEYDAKPAFANVLYFMSNTTQVSVGGVARGMVRVGTPAAKVDSFARCDPSSDNTLTWRYWSIRTGNASRPKIYGWIPTPCPASKR